MIKKFDAIVIGMGQAGSALAARLNRESFETAIVERKLIGDTRVNIGCILTKTLAVSAKSRIYSAAGRYLITESPSASAVRRILENLRNRTSF